MSFSIALPQYKPNFDGIIAYDGPSLFDGKRIVVIITGFNNKSDNAKTGNMLQSWIMRADINPFSAIWEGKDCTVCNKCKHRSVKAGGLGTCYVNVAQAPLGVWRKWKRGGYSKPTVGMLAYFKDRMIRVGSYGDGLAVPFEVWETILKEAKGHTMYSHSWDNSNIDPRFKSICMASTDNEVETNKARSMGWRTFHVRNESDPILAREFVCPASIEAGSRLTCEKCGACNGGSFNRAEDGKFKIGRGTPTIIVHGMGWKIRRFAAVMKRVAQKKGWADLIPSKKVVKA